MCLLNFHKQFMHPVHNAHKLCFVLFGYLLLFGGDWAVQSKFLQWYQNFNPKPEWAKRYNLDYDKAIDYLLASEKKWKHHKKKSVDRVTILFFVVVSSSIVRTM